MTSSLFATLVFLSLRFIICRTRRSYLIFVFKCLFAFFSGVFSTIIRYSERIKIVVSDVVLSNKVNY